MKSKRYLRHPFQQSFFLHIGQHIFIFSQHCVAFGQHLILSDESFQHGKAYKNKYRVCGPFCNENDDLVLCPSCKMWFWHLSCLKKIHEKRGIDCKTGDDSNWNCIHCLKTH